VGSGVDNTGFDVGDSVWQAPPDHWQLVASLQSPLEMPGSVQSAVSSTEASIMSIGAGVYFCNWQGKKMSKKSKTAH
jgi:hypothetical protein